MIYQFDPDDLDMVSSFVEEAATENLKRAEEALLRLEQTDSHSDLLNEVFRQIHTVKGISSFLGFAEIVKLGRQTEVVLESLRLGMLQFRSEMVGVLLMSRDCLLRMVNTVSLGCDQAGNNELFEVEVPSDRELDELIAQLQALLINVVEVPNSQTLQSTAKQKNDGSNESHGEVINKKISIIVDELLVLLDINPTNVEPLRDLLRYISVIKENLDELMRSAEQRSDRTEYGHACIDILTSLEQLADQIITKGIPIPGEIINLFFSSMSLANDVIESLTLSADFKINVNVEELLQGIQDAEDLLNDQPVAANRSEIPLALDEGIGPHDIMPIPNAKSVSNTPTVRATDLPTSHSIRVSEDKLDRLIAVIGELAVAKNAFPPIARRLLVDHELPGASKEVKVLGQLMSRISDELQHSVMSMRMIEMRSEVQKLPRVLRDLALQFGKNINLVLEGEETEIDKLVAERIREPMMHMVRNAADHGIETPEEREANGKPKQGTVWIRAYNRGSYINIEMEDDGRGMDPVKIKQKAVEKGYISQKEAERMGNEEALQLVFLPGFSTAGVVSEISGRGVGMDVVQSNVAAIGGSVQIYSQLGKGTRTVLKLPVTLVVSRGLLIESGHQSYILPLESVIEVVKVNKSDIVGNKELSMLQHRDEILGMVSMADLLAQEPLDKGEVLSAVILSDGASKIGIIVDRIISEEDVVVKSLQGLLSQLPCVSGGVILGDGTVAIVLHPAELVALAITEHRGSQLD
jgi:two-component system chemotaxis sensor kinase CheA